MKRYAFAIFALLVLGVLGTYAVIKKPNALPNIQKENWETYKNEEYRFEFKYPETYDLTIRVLTENGSREAEYRPGIKVISNDSEVQDLRSKREIYVTISNFHSSSLEDKKELRRQKNVIDQGAPFSDNIFFYVATSTFNASGARGIKGLYLGQHVGAFTSFFFGFDQYNNKISVWVPLYDLTNDNDQNRASRDPRNSDLNEIASTLRFF